MMTKDNRLQVQVTTYAQCYIINYILKVSAFKGGMHSYYVPFHVEKQAVA